LVKELRSIVPGYVFFEHNKINESEYIFYPLHYSNNEKVLRGNDLNFVKWLKGNNGIVKISKVKQVGKKIQIIEGPIKGLEDKIIKINKRQKCIGIRMEGEGIRNTIWLSYEYVS
jgi:hypothetical protein